MLLKFGTVNVAEETFHPIGAILGVGHARPHTCLRCFRISRLTASTDFEGAGGERVAADRSSRHFVEALLLQAGIRDRRRLHDNWRQHILAEERSEKRNDIHLRHIMGIVTRQDISNEIVLKRPAVLLDDLQDVARHLEKLIYVLHVEHGWMDRDEKLLHKARRASGSRAAAAHR